MADIGTSLSCSTPISPETAEQLYSRKRINSKNNLRFTLWGMAEFGLNRSSMCSGASGYNKN
jgi:hypothetical protein